MICSQFENLTIIEKIQLIGKLNHLVQTYESAFNVAVSMINKAEKDGLLSDIVIIPETKDNVIKEANC